MSIRSLFWVVFVGLASAAIDLTPEAVNTLVTSHVQQDFYAQISSLFESDQFTSGNSLHGMLVQTSSFSSTGFLQQSVYSNADGTEDTNCVSVTYTAGYAANSCFTTKKFAFIIRLADNTGASCNNAIVQYFSDPSCQRYIGFSELSAKANTCMAMTSESGAANHGRQKFQCTLSADPSLASNSVTNGMYLSSNCNGLTFGYINYAPNKCNKMKVGGSNVFTKYDCQQDLPGFSVYSDNQCTSAVVSRNALSTTCAADSSPNNDPIDPSTSSEEQDDDHYVPPFASRPSASITRMPQSQSNVRTSSNFYCTVRAPTRMPAFAPSAFPTQRLTTPVSFPIRQLLRGINAATFNGNPLNRQVLIQTIADAMTGLTAANIQGLTVADSAARRRLRVHKNSVHRRLQADQAVDVTYMVGANSVYTAEQLQNELNSALASGAFTSNLNTNADNAGATDMSGTSSNAITAPSPGSSGLSSGAVAGIIIGCAVVVIILLFMIIYCCCCYGKDPNPTYAVAYHEPVPASAPPPCTALVVAPSTAVVVPQSRAVVVAQPADKV